MPQLPMVPQTPPAWEVAARVISAAWLLANLPDLAAHGVDPTVFVAQAAAGLALLGVRLPKFRRSE